MRRKRRFKGKRNADRFFMLLAVLLIGYAMTAGKEDANKPLPGSSPDTSAAAVEREELVDPDEGSAIDKLLPNFEAKETATSTALDLRLGEGTAAQCGQQAKVHYITFLLDGTQIENTSKEGEPVLLRIGSGEKGLVPGLEQFAMGMRKNGERQVTLPPEKAYDAMTPRRKEVPLGSPIGLKLRMEEVVEDPYFYEVPGGHFTIIGGDSRRMVWCGEEVALLIYNIDTEHGNLRARLPESAAQHISFATAKKQVPFWLEQAVVGNGRLPPMNLGGVRVVQLDEPLLNGSDTKHWKVLDDLGVKREGLVTLRLHLVAIGDEKAGDAGTKEDKKTEATPEEEEKGATLKEPEEEPAADAEASEPEEKLPQTLPESE